MGIDFGPLILMYVLGGCAGLIGLAVCLVLAAAAAFALSPILGIVSIAGGVLSFRLFDTCARCLTEMM